MFKILLALFFRMRSLYSVGVVVIRLLPRVRRILNKLVNTLRWRNAAFRISSRWVNHGSPVVSMAQPAYPATAHGVQGTVVVVRNGMVEHSLDSRLCSWWRRSKSSR